MSFWYALLFGAAVTVVVYLALMVLLGLLFLTASITAACFGLVAFSIAWSDT